MPSWKEIYNEPSKQNYTPEQWQEERKRYFREEVIPKLPDDIDTKREKWAKFNEFADSLAGVKVNISALPDENQTAYQAVMDVARKSPEELEQMPSRPYAQGAARYMGMMRPLTEGLLSASGLNPFTDRIMQGYDEKLQDMIKAEQTGMIQQPNLLSKVAYGATQSTLGKMLYSLNDQSLRQKIEESEKPENRPQGNLVSSLANIATDIPIYLAGGSLGGYGATAAPALFESMGAFGLKAGLDALYNAKLSGELPMDASLSPDEMKRLENVVKEVGKETAIGMAEGAVLHGVSKLTGRVIEEVGLHKVYKALKPAGMTFKEFRDAFMGTYGPTSRLGRYAARALETGAEAGALTVAGAALRGQMPTFESFRDNVFLIGFLKLAHTPFERGAPKLDYQSKIRAADILSDKLHVDRNEAFRIMRDPERANAAIDRLTEQMTKENFENLQNVGRDIAEVKVDKLPKNTINLKNYGAIKDLRQFMKNMEQIGVRTVIVPDERYNDIVDTIKDQLPEGAKIPKFGIQIGMIEYIPESIYKKEHLKLVKTPITPIENAPAPDLENVVETVYPRGWDQKAEKVTKRAYSGKKYEKAREQMDAVINEVWPMMKENPEMMRDQSKDQTAIESQIDPHKTGYDKLSPGYKKQVLNELSKMAANQLRGYETGSTADIQPYQKVIPWNAGSESNRIAFEEMNKSIKPLDELSPEQKTKATIASSDNGEAIVLPSFSERLKSSGPHEIEKHATEMAQEYYDDVHYDRTTSKIKRAGRFVNNRFIASLDARMGATEAGKEMAQMAKRYEREVDMFRGDTYEEPYTQILNKLKVKGKIPKNIETAIVDFLDYGEIKDRGLPLLPKEMDKVEWAVTEIKKLTDDVFKRGRELGLKEFHPSVMKWKIAEDEQGFKIINENGKILGNFQTEKQANNFRLKHLYTDLMYREHYFSHILNPQKLKDLNEVKKLSEILVDTGQVKDLPALEGKTKEQIRRLQVGAMERLIIEEGVNVHEKRYGNLQIEREYRLPEDWLIRDLEVMYQYFDRAATRLKRAEIFGVMDEKLFGKAVDVASEASQKFGKARASQEWHNALNLAQSLTDRIVHDPEASWLANALMNFQVVRKMILSPLSQVPQMFYGIWRAGQVSSFIKGLNSLRDPEMRSMIKRAGVNLHSSQRWIVDQFGGATAAEWLLNKNKFVKMDMAARTVNAAQGGFFADWVAQKLSKNYSVDANGIIRRRGAILATDKGGTYRDRYVREAVKLDLDPKEIITNKGELTDLQRRTAMRKFEVDTNFRQYAWNLPEFRQSMFGKFVTQFKTFNYAMTKSLRDNVLKEMKYGNFKPLLYLMLVCGVTGAFTDEVKGWISGRESGFKRLSEGDLPVIADWMVGAGALGIFGDLIYATKYGDPGLGASFNDMIKVSSTVSSALRAKKLETAGKTVLKGGLNLMPLGSRWRRTAQMILNPRVRVKPEDLIILPREKVNPSKYK